MENNIEKLLKEYGYNKMQIEKILKISHYPYELTTKKILDIQSYLLEKGYTEKEINKMTTTQPELYGLSIAKLERTRNYLLGKGYTESEINEITISLPAIYGYKNKNVDKKITYLKFQNLNKYIINNPKLLMQSVELTYARSCFLVSQGYIIGPQTFKYLFLDSLQFKRKFKITNEKIKELYPYDDYKQNLIIGGYLKENQIERDENRKTQEILYYEEFEKQKKEKWMQGYNLAYRFYIFHGTLDIPLDYIIDGFPLGHWIDSQRKYKKTLTINQKKLLDNIKMKWHIKWNYHKLRTKNEIRFGEEQYAKWIENWKIAKDYFEENGHLNIPADYKIKLENGKTFHLGAWLQNQKTNFSAQRLPAERMEKLDSIFAVFDNTNQKEIQRILNVKDHNFLPPYLKNIDPFKEKPIDVIFNGGHLPQKVRLQRNISYLKVYFDNYNDLNIPQKYSVELDDGSIIHLGSILTYMRKKHREGTLTQEAEKQLEAMNIVWNPKDKKQNNPKLNDFERLLNTASLEDLKSLEQHLKHLEQIADEVELEYSKQEKQKNLTK